MIDEAGEGAVVGAAPVSTDRMIVSSLVNVVETMGLEPTTPCLQSRCSSQLSYVPRAGAR